MKIYLRIMHVFRIPITPAKEKKIKLSRYTDKAIAKRAKRQQEKEARKAQKKEAKKQQKLEKKQQQKQKKTEQSSSPASGRTLSDNISLIIDIVKVFFGRFFTHLRIDLSRIHISIAGADAAQTAIMYGAVCQSVAYLLEIMERLKTTFPPDLSDVSVTPDWTGEKTRVDIKLSFSMRVGNVFDIVGRVIGRAISHLFADMRKKRKNLPKSNRRPPSSRTPSKKTVVKTPASQTSTSSPSQQ